MKQFSVRLTKVLVGVSAVSAIALFAISQSATANQSKLNIAYTADNYPYVKGEYLIKANSLLNIKKLLEIEGFNIQLLSSAKTLMKMPNSVWYKVNLPEDIANHLMSTLSSNGLIAVEPNYVLHANFGSFYPYPTPKPTVPPKPTVTPKPNMGGPDYGQIPELPNPPIEDPNLSSLYGLKLIKADEAWKQAPGSKDVVVAVIDTGIDYNHEDLINNLWHNPKEIPDNGIDDDNNGYIDDSVGWDFVEKDSRPYDDNSHGSHTSGTVGATYGNGKGVSGVAQKVSIMALRFLGGSQGTGTSEGAISAIQYATNNGAHIMSNSWGGGGYSQAMYDAIKVASDKGILFVAASGNVGSNNDSKASYPCGYDVPNVISVAATDSQDLLAYFSNYGATTVDLSAPGVKILSSIPNNKYNSYDGTSMATPHVSGVAALIKSAYPQLTAVQIKDAIMKGVDVLPTLNGKMVTGGRLNALKALEEAKKMVSQ